MNSDASTGCGSSPTDPKIAGPFVLGHWLLGQSTITVAIKATETGNPRFNIALNKGSHHYFDPISHTTLGATITQITTKILLFTRGKISSVIHNRHLDWGFVQCVRNNRHPDHRTLILALFHHLLVCYLGQMISQLLASRTSSSSRRHATAGRR